ncbi:tyrosine-protein phosphatase [Streptomyces sp. A5-4]|uniref:tyrosine-protein phosphatase n=1 Tax=Streptomyces sp. A5-4 TaxID=3384771 RepID=UPI003DAA19C6
MSRARMSLATGAALAALALGTLPAPALAGTPTAGPAPAAQQSLRGDEIRRVPLEGAVNVRDVGGYRTYGGDTVRHGQVYRADVVTLSRLGLKKVVDYRVPVEVQFDGADRLPAGLVPVSRPVTDNGLFTQLLTVIGSKDPVKQEEMLGGGRAAAFMREVYRTFVTSPENRARFGATLRDIAEGSRGAPLLYHCTAGKDRTGWTSYLLLLALGVPSLTAEQDYLASNTYRAAYDAKLRDGLKQSGLMQNPDLLIPLQEVRTDYLRSALDRVAADYGGLHQYLGKGLGLDFRTIAKLQARLLR